LTLLGDYNDSPVWSPRGDKIAYVSRREGRFQIMTVDLNGENVVQLTASAGSNEDPSWSPDGYRLVFSSTREGKSDLYSMEWNGENVRRLTHRGNCTSPAWSANVRPKEFFDCKK
jgi:TolB protein